jgi:GNAT superfamily N-acetyltransferase
MSLTLRPAEPRDAEFLGWVCVAAARSQFARGWFDIVLQRDEAFVLEFAKHLTVTKAVSWWHWSLFQVAEIDGVPASAMCGIGDSRVFHASAAAMAEASGKMGIGADEQAQFWPRGSFIMTATTGEDGAWTVENVATRAEFRGRGAAQALLARQVEIAHGEGFKRAQISFFIGNDGAERSYAKAGFTFAEEKHSPEFEAAMGCPGIRRFARDV